MILNRIVTRLAVVEALSNFFREPFPTVAGNLIFDSQIEPNARFEKDAAVPLCVVYTDYDKDFPVFRGFEQKKRSMTITVEILVVQASESVDNKNTYDLSTPTTDSELEMTLDVFELQVFKALRGPSSAGNCFSTLCSSLENVISRRGASVEGGQRLAARQVTIEADIMRDPDPGVLPPYVDKFLTDIEAFDLGTRDRALALRDLFLAPEEQVFAGNAQINRNLSTEAGDILGLPRRGAPLLPQSGIRWFSPSGQGFLT